MAEIQFQFYHYKDRGNTSTKGKLSFVFCVSPAEKYISGTNILYIILYEFRAQFLHDYGILLIIYNWSQRLCSCDGQTKP